MNEFEEKSMHLIRTEKLLKAVTIYREMDGHYFNESIASRISRETGCSFDGAWKVIDFVDHYGLEPAERSVRKTISELRAELREILA